MNRIMGMLFATLALQLIASAETERIGFGAGIGMFEGDWGAVGRKDFVMGAPQRHEIILQGGLYNQNRWTVRLDADYHFVFLPDGLFRFYPLAGVDLAIQNKNNRTGINLGGGMTLSLREQISAFLEAKYTFGDWDGFALTAGIYF